MKDRSWLVLVCVALLSIGVWGCADQGGGPAPTPPAAGDDDDHGDHGDHGDGDGGHGDTDGGGGGDAQPEPAK